MILSVIIKILGFSTNSWRASVQNMAEIDMLFFCLTSNSLPMAYREEWATEQEDID